MNYDIIVIGGGHNGLSAAIRLARAGKEVIVLEKLKNTGGLASGHEFLPGYWANSILHDSSCVRPSIIEKLRLKKYGLKYSEGRPPVHILSNNGDGITLKSDLEETCDSISKISVDDGHAYYEYRYFIKSLSGFTDSILNEVQPAFQDYWQLIKKAWALRKLGKKTMTEILKVGPMCVADFLNEKFESELLKSGIAIPAVLGSFCGPWSSYTALNLLSYEASSNVTITGGAIKLIESLHHGAIDAGVEIKCDSEVSRIVINDHGKVKGVRLESGEEMFAPVVAASNSPKEVFLKLLQSNEIGPKLESRIIHLRSRGTIAKLNLALNNKIRWKSEFDGPGEYARTGSSIDVLERAFDPIKYNEYSKNPVLDIYVPTISNPEMAPEGHEVVSIIAGFVPYELKDGWNDHEREYLKNSIIDFLSEYIIGLKKSITGYELLTPKDIEDRFNIPGGNIFHLEHAVDQMIGRPVPECSRYKTPIPGLFLCGSGTHPGGGLTCVPGILASEAILKGFMNN